MEDKKNQSYIIPISIIIGFTLIATAIFFSGKAGKPAVDISDITSSKTSDKNKAQPANPDAINPITKDDHIRGNPNAQILLVEYSDYDCPFCKRFHSTLQQVIGEYGSDGRVAWVYRHFPIEQLHPNAPRLAEASECVAKLGGNDAFWSFTDSIFEGRKAEEQTNPVSIPGYVTKAGVDLDKFNACQESREMQSAFEEDAKNALAIGGKGTPHTVILVGDQQGVINGAQPYSVVKKIIDDLLAQLDSGG